MRKNCLLFPDGGVCKELGDLGCHNQLPPFIYMCLILSNIQGHNTAGIRNMCYHFKTNKVKWLVKYIKYINAIKTTHEYMGDNFNIISFNVYCLIPTLQLTNKIHKRDQNPIHKWEYYRSDRKWRFQCFAQHSYW